MSHHLEKTYQPDEITLNDIINLKNKCHDIQSGKREADLNNYIFEINAQITQLQRKINIYQEEISEIQSGVNFSKTHQKLKDLINTEKSYIKQSLDRQQKFLFEQFN